ncbi:MAG: ISAzo13 family transposase, partial [Deltaproteobacteria bacterium]|nr:ISAzo13 family transposase [Deltaproteobacteria bacterium]
MDIVDRDKLAQSIDEIFPHLNERQRRLFAASQAKKLGHGGITLISELCGLSRVTITNGMKELQCAPVLYDRVRLPGSGRPTIIST